MRCLLCLFALVAFLLALLALLARIACMRRHASWYRHATIAFGAAGCPHRRCLPRLRVMPCVPSLRLIAGRSRLRQPLHFARWRSLRLLGHEVILLCELSGNFGRYFFDMGLCAGPRRRRGRPRARAWRTACRSLFIRSKRSLKAIIIIQRYRRCYCILSHLNRLSKRSTP